MNTSSADIGLVGLAVMGQNLVMNMADNGFTVAVYNRTQERTTEFVQGPAADMTVIGTGSLEELVSNLKRPRRVMLMVQAGAPVDAVIESLIPLLEPGDIIVDGGNSNYLDTQRRLDELAVHGIHFVGAGISGGEEGARNGPSIMPGGDRQAWPHLQAIFEAIAAKVDGTPCCRWLGSGGSGHFVKMVHNGIEYGDMQLIAETYHLLKDLLGMDHQRMSDVFSDWNRGRLDSYLIEITSEILAFKDEDGSPLVEKILDSAGQKGTGKWTVNNALEQGTPLTLIGEAVFARFLSALKDERVAASEVLTGPDSGIAPEADEFLVSLEQALYSAKVISYAQGYMLLASASDELGWELDLSGIALIWRGGCIIRSAFLNDIASAFAGESRLPNLLFDPFFRDAINADQAGWRQVVAAAVTAGIPVPALGSALHFFDGYRSATVPANMLQAQRDYFGAHTFERIDRERGEHFHVDWTGHGGKVSSTVW